MRIISLFTTCLTALLLTACGGGGGSPGVGSGAVQALSVAAPAAVTLQVGLTQQYVVKGGVKPYTVYSSDPAVVAGWLVGEDVLAVGTVAAGVATVTLQDSKGTKFPITVTAGSSTPFFTTAPTELLIAPGALGAQTYKLGGGTPPYKAVSSFPRAVSVVVNGNDVTITALQVAGSPGNVQAATITFTDSSAVPTPLTTAVRLGSIPLFVTPSILTGLVGDIFRAVITGGTPPYRVIVNIDESLLSARIVNGNQLEVVGGQVAAGAGVQIIDANNVSVDVKITLSVGQDVLRIQPSEFSFPENTATPDLTLMVYGASGTGAIQVFTSDATILKPLAPVKNVDGSGYAITLTGGDTCSAPVQAAMPGVDNTDPPNGNFTDLVAGVPTFVIQPVADVAPVQATGGDRTITITVIDAKGKLGTSKITVKDANGKAGC